MVLHIVWKLIVLHPQILPVLVFVPSIVFSLCRTMALYKYYTAPILVYNELAYQRIPTLQELKEHYQEHQLMPNYVDNNNNDNDHHFNITAFQERYVCTCGEWYRYPSSFFLPLNSQLGYLPSSFHGQLPQPYTKYGSKPHSLQYLSRGSFNDQNQPNNERYIPNELSKYVCNWYVVLQNENQDTLCGWPNVYGKSRVAVVPFLDSIQTKSFLHRIIYIPYIHETIVKQRWTNQIVYDDYVVYQEIPTVPIRSVQPISLPIISFLNSSTVLGKLLKYFLDDTNDSPTKKTKHNRYDEL